MTKWSKSCTKYPKKHLHKAHSDIYWSISCAWIICMSTCKPSAQTRWLDTASSAGKMNSFWGETCVVSDFVCTKEVFLSICSPSNESWVSAQTPAKTDRQLSISISMTLHFFSAYFLQAVMVHLMSCTCVTSSLEEVYITVSMEMLLCNLCNKNVLYVWINKLWHRNSWRLLSKCSFSSISPSFS